MSLRELINAAKRLASAQNPDAQSAFASLARGTTRDRVGGRTSCVETYSVAGGLVSTAGAGWTWQQVVAMRRRPYAVRVGYWNSLTTGWTIDKTTVMSSAVFNSGGDPVGGTRANVLFGGSAPCVMAGIPENGGSTPTVIKTNYTISDWTYVAPVDRTDVPGAYNLLYFRSYVAGAGVAYQSNAGITTYPGNTAAGLIRQGGWNNSGDTTASTGAVYSNPGHVLPMTVEAQVIGRVIRVASIGDSIEQNVDAAAGGIHWGFIERACAALNAVGPAKNGGAYFSHMNLGIGSTYLANFLARIPGFLATFADNMPDVFCIPTYSPNGPPQSQADLDWNIYAVLAAIRILKQYGIVPILRAGTPNSVANGYNANKDSYRIKSNAFFASASADFGYIFVDCATPVVIPGSPSQWNPAFSSDLLHPNSACDDLWSLLYAPAILRAI